MDVVSIIATLLVGLLLGASAAWLLLRGRATSVMTERENLLRAEAERARAEAANARAEASGVRANEARSETAVERSRTEVAEARAEVAGIRARMAELQAQVATAEAERDAAVQRAVELSSDRESLLAQFKNLSNDVLDRQSKVADASADQRLQATEQIMAPMKAAGRFENRPPRSKERVAIASGTKQVRSVQQTGEQVRRETSALTTALRKPQVRARGASSPGVVELAGMVEHCDSCSGRRPRTTGRPALKVMLAEGKFVYVDSRCR